MFKVKNALQFLHRYRNRCHLVRCLASAEKARPEIDLSADDIQRRFSGIVLGLYERGTKVEAPKLTSTGQAFDQKTEGKLSELVQKVKLSGEIGTAKVLHNISADFDAVAVVGLGRKDIGFDATEGVNQSMENVRVAAGVGVNVLRCQRCTDICIDGMDFPEQAAEGSFLSAWKYEEHLSEHNRTPDVNLKVYGTSEMGAWLGGVFRAEAQNIARTLCEMPRNVLTPTELGNKAVELLCPCDVGVKVHDENWIGNQKMNGTMAVACTSCERPVFVEINYSGGASDAKPILLVGNGITFDSGGLNLKAPEHLAETRASMAGAAVVIAAVRAAAQLQIPVNIVGLIPICEHMTSGLSIRMSDVIHFSNGQTFQVDTSSNPNILTMADALWYGRSNYKPQLILGIGALTRSHRDTLGDAVTPLFTNSDAILKEMLDSAGYSGDRVWRLPFSKQHEEHIRGSPSADAARVGCGNASAAKCAAFLGSFAGENEFALLDVDATGMLNQNADAFPYLEEDRMTGRPTRTLIQLLAQLSAAKPKPDQKRA